MLPRISHLRTANGGVLSIYLRHLRTVNRGVLSILYVLRHPGSSCTTSAAPLASSSLQRYTKPAYINLCGGTVAGCDNLVQWHATYTCTYVCVCDRSGGGVHTRACMHVRAWCGAVAFLVAATSCRISATSCHFVLCADLPLAAAVTSPAGVRNLSHAVHLVLSVCFLFLQFF